MPKRSLPDPTGEEENTPSGILSEDDQDPDIFAVLTGQKKRRISDHEAQISEDDDEDLQEIIRQATAKRDMREGTQVVKKVKGKTKITKGEVGGGSFQSMGLHPSLLRSLTLQGFRVPTPIQRLSIPLLLTDPPQDLVGMARTGSGKSLAYMIPLAQRLGGRHSTTFGARALILLPTRELALQILKVGKELVRGWNSGEGNHAGDNRSQAESSRSQNLRWGLVVGGEGMDEQFQMMSNNPDVIIATPGRLLHLIVEMNLDLKSVQYVVFDEADRLFEMGFETALTEIIHRLPPVRQTLLFSATLPKSLVEFAKAGLQNPKLVRLDAEGKISTELQMAFFSVKQAEKDACLLYLLRDVIGVPMGSRQLEEMPEGKGKKKATSQYAAPHQTLVFAATKHHVEYLTVLLTTAGYSISQIYGTLDQTARSIQMDRFRRGITNVLVVTDVAARGIDIPVLENVVNYDFPTGARVFIHRVGRTARAGRTGWAWSFVTTQELPYLLDLQLFLGRPLKHRVASEDVRAWSDSLILGPFPRDAIDQELESIKALDAEDGSIQSLREIMRKGQGMYERSKGKASQASYKRAKEISKDPASHGITGTSTPIHPVLFHRPGKDNPQAQAAEDEVEEEKRAALLKVINSFAPAETVLEVSHKAHKGKGTETAATLMKERRRALKKAVDRAALASVSKEEPEEEDEEGLTGRIAAMADEDDIAEVFNVPSSKGKKGCHDYKDSEYYMSYVQKDADTEKGYSLRDGASFTEQARNATFDLAGDETLLKQRRRKQMTWDKKRKKFVQGDGVGADNVKLVNTESGVKLPATYRSGRFEEWKSKNRKSLPRVGEAESSRGGQGGKRYLHTKVVAPKQLDKTHVNYERKARQRKKKDADASGAGEGEEPQQQPRKGGKKAVLGRRYGGKTVGRVKSELKTVDQIRKARKVAEHRKAKNARPSRKGKGKGRR